MGLGMMVGAVGNGTRYDGGSSWEWTRYDGGSSWEWD